ncbi:hypothetical protein GXW74_14855 [Roseomonas eburnea]|uniref:Zinc finger/thioredoxin putative domain-containing protein n=1 Tax=Neoroseomonas eburnea TaxID=1346889 RepID=A0A9X9XDI6_9PROT|nr:zinc-ribbon domain-containing protein [Neoroseomonas eburnea]MBR0681772.1 hypothetical protein [Neoroseomonas eburnea]
MRIACPSCSTEYDVPDRLLAGAARTLRCSRCAAVFPLPHAEPPAAEAPRPPPALPSPARDAEPAPTAVPLPPMGPRPPIAAEPKTDRALIRAWVASLVVVVGAAVALVMFRSSVMTAWPPATRLFGAIGLG